MNTEHKAKPKICCEQVSKTFIQKGNQEVPVISNVSINVHENEFLVVCGPGQCGKSTLLKIIAGLELPDTGTVTIDGKEISGPGTDCGMVFQSYMLFAWKTVRHNVEMGLKFRNVPPISVARSHNTTLTWWASRALKIITLTSSLAA